MRTMTIGNGTAIHTAYTTSDGDLYGSLCNPFAYSTRSRLRFSDREATCPRCAKAVHRAAEETSTRSAIVR